MLAKLPTYLLIFVIFSAGIIFAAYDYYRDTEVKFRQQIEAELLTIAKLKTDQLISWRKQRLGNAILSQNALIRTAYRTPRLSHKNFTCLNIDSRAETESAKFSMAA